MYFTNARAVAAIQNQELSVGNVYVYNLIAANTLFANGLVIQGLDVTTSILAGNIAANTTSTSELISNNITTHSITANVWNKLFTANVKETAGNLYYTIARANTAIDNRVTKTFVENLNINVPNADHATSADSATTAGSAGTVDSISNFTTTDLAEGTNLYYTNTRVYANVSPLLALKANVKDLTTSNVVELNNLYYTNTRVYANVIGLLNAKANVVDLTTSNIIEGNNLYYTNARVESNVTSILVNYATVANLNLKANTVDLTTANVVELNNLYYTNSRVLSYVTTYLNAKANVTDLTTSNVTEGNNLYYTNARVRSTISAGDATIVYDPVAGTIKANSTITASLENRVNNLSTTDVTEGINLYYTNARVYSNVITLLPTLAGAGIAIEANGQIRSTTSIATLVGLNTANVLESASNLYYTNARARAALSSGTGVSYDTETGVIAIGQNVSPNASVTFAGLNVFGQTNFYGNVTTHASNNLSVSDNMIYLNSGSESSNPDLGIAFNYNDGAYHHAGFFRDHNDGRFKVFDNYSPEPDANVYIDTNHATFRLANIQANIVFAGLVGNVTGFVSSISNFSTSDLVEGNNLYYTNARVSTQVQSSLALKANVTDLTTANVAELNNLYYTNARVYSNVIGLLNAKANVVDLTTSNVVEGNNLYFTNARVNAQVESNLALKANIVDLTTSNVAELNNLYYTNTRVYSNVISILTNYATVANLSLKANIVDLTTSNVVELNNLYYTNARVYSNVIGLLDAKANVTDLTTTNVIEGNNLYYTNSRVYSNVLSILATYTGNIAAGNIIAGGGTITGANVISTNTIIASIWTGIYTANVIESASNLYFTNARVYANVFPLLAAKANVTDLTTANVAELTNLYYTNARVYSNVIGLLNAKANVVDLTTSNVVEGNNLYYTNARVYSNVLALLPTYTGNVGAGNVNIGGTQGGFITGANVISTNTIIASIWTGLYTANVIESSSALYYTNARVYSNVIGVLTNYATIANLALKANIVDLTTANVAELNNLYYTNARVYSNVSPLLAIKANVTDLTTANVVESASNLYYTVARANTAIDNRVTKSFIDNLGVSSNTALFAETSNVANTVLSISNFTTSNLTEGTNLYFSNARVLAGLVGQNVDINDLLVRGDLIVQGNTVTLNTATVIVEDKNIVLANGAISSGAADGAGFSIDGAQANLTYRSTGDKFEFNKPLDIIGTLTAATVSANVWNNLYTSNVLENAGNLYYTVARANTAIDNRVTKAFVEGLGISVSTAVFAETSNVANTVTTISNFTTTNLAEGTNLYYSNSRVYANVVSILTNYATVANLELKANIVDLTTSNVVELNNLYYTNSRVYSNVIAALQNNVAIGNIIGNVTVTGNLIANGLIIRGINVTDSVLAGNVTSNATISDTIVANSVTANVWNNLYTANVIESASNLYYTNTRVYSNVIALLPTLAGSGISIAANGRISAVSTAQSIIGLNTANVSESASNLYYTNARVYSNVIALLPNVGVTINSSYEQFVSNGAATVFTLSNSVASETSIFVVVDGLVQTPTLDYTASGTTLTLTSTPADLSNIVVRYFSAVLVP